jgi:hypothetical protein
MSTNEEGNSNEKLYPQGIHVSIWKLPNSDKRKRLAMVLRNPIAKEDDDNINSIEILPEDDRVAFVETCGHGFFHLTKQVGTHPVGTCIGEEDEGIERIWIKILGWNNPYQKDGVKMEDDDEDNE